jgi:hemerythrin superfamily protein
MPDITKLIETDHREVEGLFAQFKSDQSRATASKICDELEKHSTAEEKVFYPVVQTDVPEGDELASEARDEHAQAKQLISQVRSTQDDDGLTQLVTQLEQAITHHVQEEESEMLPKARESLDARRLDELGSQFEDAKQA